MGNESSSLQRQFWLLACKGDLKALRTALKQLTPETRTEFLEWTDPKDRWTPLAIATLNGNVACARELLMTGANADAKGVGGRTPLQLAINRDNAELVRVLIAGSADVNALDARGRTPLLLAVRLGSHASVKELINVPEIDVFACEAFSGMDAFKCARHAYGKMGFSNRLNHKKCLELIEKKLLIRLGWIFEATSSPQSWTKRYYMVFRTADTNAVKIEVFDVQPGGRPPPRYSDMRSRIARLLSIVLTHLKWSFVCSFQLVYHASDRIQAIVPAENNNDRPEFSFTFRCCRKSRISEPTIFEFAALNQVEFEFWTNFPISWKAHDFTATVSEPEVKESIDALPSTEPQEDLQLLENAVHLSSPEEVRPARYVRLHVPESPTAEQKLSTCVVCYDGAQSVVCVPCGHVAMCMNCANQVMNSTRVCPVCRMNAREIIKIFRL